MLKQEYAQHIAEMSQRVRCEEWAELEKNKEDFFETGNTWALSWLGHLTVLDAAMYHYTGKAEWLERVKECLGIFFSVQDELVQRYEDGSLPFIYKQEDGKPIEGPSKNPLEVLEENDTDPWHFQVVETIFSFTHRPRRIHAGGMEQAGDLVLCGDQPHLPRLRMGTAQPRHIAGHRAAAVCKAVPAKRVRRALSEAGGYAV